MITLRNRKSTFIKFLTTFSLALMALLSIGLTSNTAQAAKVKPIYMLQTSKQYNHYIKLAKRKGTHYFKGHYVALHSFSQGSIVAKGTKTIHGKHYFIDKDGIYHDSEAGIDYQAKNFYQPTAYKIVSRSKLTAYGLPGIDFDDSDKVDPDNNDPYLKTGAKLLVFTHQKDIINGVTYYPFCGYDDMDGGHIKASDMKKLKKTNITQPTFYGNKPNWTFHGSKLVHGPYADKHYHLYEMKHVMD